jgi:hypothetical protein
MKSGIAFIVLGILVLSDIFLAWIRTAWGIGVFLIIMLLLLFVARSEGRTKGPSTSRHRLAEIGAMVLYWVAYGLIEAIWGEIVAHWAAAISFMVIGLVYIIHASQHSQKSLLDT